MSTTRRELLVGAGALSVLPVVGCKDDATTDDSVAGTPERPPEPEPWEPDGAPDAAAFPYGVQVGDATASAALVSLWSGEAEVTFEVARAEGQGWTVVDTIAATLADGRVQVEVTGLEPDTAYSVVARGGGGRSRASRFRTALAPDGFRVVTLGSTSCLGRVNTSFASLARAAEERPDAMLMLGDFVYADGSRSVEAYRAFYEAAMATPAVQDISASASWISTWDDHETDNNWVVGEEGVTEEVVAMALQVFREALPQRQGPGGTGIWRKHSIGDVVDVIVLDSRGERSEGAIVSQEQLDWAREALLTSAARFKVVLASVHFADHSALWGGAQATDRWQGYPEQREALLDAMLQVEGVLVVTGDMHYGGYHFLAPPGQPGEHIPEIMAGPAGSFINPLADLASTSDQYPMFLPTWTAAMLRLDPGTGEVGVRFLNDEGEVLGEATFNL